MLFELCWFGWFRGEFLVLLGMLFFVIALIGSVWLFCLGILWLVWIYWFRLFVVYFGFIVWVWYLRLDGLWVGCYIGFFVEELCKFLVGCFEVVNLVFDLSGLLIWGWWFGCYVFNLLVICLCFDFGGILGLLVGVGLNSWVCWGCFLGSEFCGFAFVF